MKNNLFLITLLTAQTVFGMNPAVKREREESNPHAVIPNKKQKTNSLTIITNDKKTFDLDTSCLEKSKTLKELISDVTQKEELVPINVHSSVFSCIEKLLQESDICKRNKTLQALLANASVDQAKELLHAVEYLDVEDINLDTILLPALEEIQKQIDLPRKTLWYCPKYYNSSTSTDEGKLEVNNDKIIYGPYDHGNITYKRKIIWNINDDNNAGKFSWDDTITKMHELSVKHNISATKMQIKAPQGIFIAPHLVAVCNIDTQHILYQFNCANNQTILTAHLLENNRIFIQLLDSSTQKSWAEIRNIETKELLCTLNDDEPINPNFGSYFHTNRDVVFLNEDIIVTQCNPMYTVAGTSGVKIWDLKTGKCLFTLPNFILTGNNPSLVKQLFNDRICAVIANTKNINIYDIDTGNILKTLQGHKSPIQSLIVTKDKIISRECKNIIKIWDIETGNCLATINDNSLAEALRTQVNGYQRFYSQSSDHYMATLHNKLIYISNEKNIKIVKLDNGTLLQTLEHTNKIKSLHTTENKIICLLDNGQIAVWDISPILNLAKLPFAYNQLLYKAFKTTSPIELSAQENATLQQFLEDFGKNNGLGSKESLRQIVSKKLILDSNKDK